MGEETNPLGSILQMATGLLASRALWATAHFKIADHVTDQGIGLDDLAEKTGILPDRLKRLMHVLVTFGMFRVLPGDLVVSTPVSQMLRSDSEKSVRAWIESIIGNEHYEALGSIDAALREPTTAFEARHGMLSFDYYTAHPGAGALFAQAMSDFTFPIDASISAYDFPKFDTAIDIGGSMGTLLKLMLDRYRDARGIVFDLPDVVERAGAAWAAEGGAARLSGIGGNFFEAVPAGGDLYLLKMILHDWNDDQCVEILKNIRTAINPGGTVCIIEILVPEDFSPHPGWMADFNMMALTGGRERNRGEYESLLEQGGFRLKRDTVLAPTSFSLLEAVPE